MEHIKEHAPLVGLKASGKEKNLKKNVIDREKVLIGLEYIITNKVSCNGCPYNGSGYCLKNVAKDAKELLK